MKNNLLYTLIITCGLAACSPGSNSITDVSGVWFNVENNCEDDESALLIVQNANTLNLSGNFDYQTATPDAFPGTIIGDGIIFTNNGSDSNAICSATVVGNTLSGSCDVTGAQTETCEFEFTKNIARTYDFVENNCENDGSAITVSQNGDTLTFTGGFDYQASTPDSYSGVIQNAVSNPIEFTITGSASTATCEAMVTGSELSGTCVVTGAQAETCTFRYNDVQ